MLSCRKYVPTLTYSHDLWVVTERTKLLIQEAEHLSVPRMSWKTWFWLFELIPHLPVLQLGPTLPATQSNLTGSTDGAITYSHNCEKPKVF